jgi:hypothetical protein
MRNKKRLPEEFKPVAFTVALVVAVLGLIWEVKHTYAGPFIEWIGDSITGGSIAMCLFTSGLVGRLLNRFLKK